MKIKLIADVDFYRVVGGGLNEFVQTELFDATSKTDLMKQIRMTKKKIASESKYNINGDRIYYKINYLHSL